MPKRAAGWTMPRFDGDGLWINKRPYRNSDLAPIHPRKATVALTKLTRVMGRGTAKDKSTAPPL